MLWTLFDIFLLFSRSAWRSCGRIRDGRAFRKWQKRQLFSWISFGEIKKDALIKRDCNSVYKFTNTILEQINLGFSARCLQHMLRCHLLFLSNETPTSNSSKTILLLQPRSYSKPSTTPSRKWTTEIVFTLDILSSWKPLSRSSLPVFFSSECWSRRTASATAARSPRRASRPWGDGRGSNGGWSAD